MVEFFALHSKQIITTGILTLVLTILQYVTVQVVKKYSVKSQVLEYRKNLVI